VKPLETPNTPFFDRNRWKHLCVSGKYHLIAHFCTVPAIHLDASRNLEIIFNEINNLADDLKAIP
jgi:hypothetical protein